jgi:uncharacterized protein
MLPRSVSGRFIAIGAAVLAITSVAFGTVTLLRRAAPSPLVDDRAGLMSEAQRSFVTEYHRYLRHDHDIDYRVVTARDTGDINRFAARQFAEIGAGARSSTARGLLLVVDPAQDRVRLEVGYSLEGVFPDAFVAYVEKRQMVPFFEARRVADGILAATELIVTRAQHAAANAGFAGEAWISGSGGAGATVAAGLPKPRAPLPAARTEAKGAGATPETTLRAYVKAMSARNGDPALDLYTPETRTMLRGWIMTPAQMDTLTATYRNCHAEPARIAPDGRRAVIRYPPAERPCAPWFFRRDDDVWRLDLTMMQRAIRFGRSNAWHFNPGAEHPYGFAFVDWRFDSHGFPIARR